MGETEQEGRQHSLPQVRGAWELPARCSSKISQHKAEWGSREDSRHKPKIFHKPWISEPGKRPLQLVFAQMGELRMCFLMETSCRTKVREDGTLQDGPCRRAHVQCKYFGVPLAKELGFLQCSLAKGQGWCFALH